jgi:hypothetical protein
MHAGRMTYGLPARAARCAPVKERRADFGRIVRSGERLRRPGEPRRHGAARLRSARNSRMNPKNRRSLAERVDKAAAAALAAQNYVSPIDVLVGIGWLDPGAVKRWRQGQVDHLEQVVATNLSRVSEAMKLFRSWAVARGLVPSETDYVERAPQRRPLRFSKSGDPTIERLYNIAPIGFRASFRKASESAWWRRRTVHRNWWSFRH